jgi:TolB-like protein
MVIIAMKDKVGKTSLVCFALFMVFSASITLSGCGGMPTPRADDDCLFLLMSDNPQYKSRETYEWKDIIDFEGPTPFSITVGHLPMKLHMRRIKPGEYRVKRRYLRFPGGILRDVSMRESFTLEPYTIYLFPRKIIDVQNQQGDALPGYEVVSPDDQRWVSQTVSDYVSFSEWIGSNFEGFGPYKPRFSLEQKAYDFHIASNPAGATVYVDGTDWGSAPVTAKLEPGKHQLVLQKEGYADTRSFVNVETEGEVAIDLISLADSGTAIPAFDRISLLLVPFKNIGSDEHDRWKTVFPDSLKVGLIQDERITVVDTSQSVGGEALKDVSLRPDFSYAESKGINLLVTGHYLIKDEKVMVHAVLFDVKSEMVKTSVSYTGPSGILLFNSIDEVSQKFLDAVDKQLPEVGSEVVEERESIKSRIVSYDKKLTERQIVDKRLERPFSFSGNFIWGAMFDTIDDDPFFDNSMRSDGPPLGLGLTGELGIVGPLSLTMMFNPVYSFYAGNQGAESDGPVFDFPLYLGPRFSFMSTRNDIYFSLLGQMRYITGAHLTDQTGTLEKDFGPYWITGMSVDMGVKIYTYQRISKAPTFLNLGMILGTALWRFESGFENGEFFPMEVWLYIGYGSRL